MNELLTVKEIVEEVKMSKSTVKGWIRQGKLKSIKFGNNTIRVRREALDEFIKERESNERYN